MAMASSYDDAMRQEQFQEHQLRLQEKYARLAAQENSTHPHDLFNDGSYINAQGQIVHPTKSPYFEATPQYGLRDFDLLETLGKQQLCQEDKMTEHLPILNSRLVHFSLFYFIIHPTCTTPPHPLSFDEARPFFSSPFIPLPQKSNSYNG